MRRVFLLLTLACALCLDDPAAVAQEPQPAAQSKMTTYYLVLLNKDKAWSAETTPETTRIQELHIKHLEKLGADGFGQAAGPFGDGGNIRGIVILSAKSVDHAREVARADPAVQAGRLSTEILPFMAPEGWFQKPATPPLMEQLYFGFLVAGPNRSQDAETARRLQKEHLAYMDGQHKEGKLVMAGPFVQGGSRRGIVVYRVASAEEAKARAEGDPMVTAGRLAVELHPWYVARGVLKLP